MPQVKAELEVFESLHAAFDRLKEQLQATHSQVEIDLEETRDRISEALLRAGADAEEAQRAYQECLYNCEEDGSCDYEQAQMYRLQEVSEDIRACSQQFERDCDRYQNQSSVVGELLNKAIPRCQDELSDRANIISRMRSILAGGPQGYQAVANPSPADTKSQTAPSINIGQLIGPALTFAKIQTNRVIAKANQLQGDYAENRGMKVLKKVLGAEETGLGLHIGKQGIDVYGFRNKPKGRTLMLMEVKSTRKQKAKGTVKEVIRLLKRSKDGFQQASQKYGEDRLAKAERLGNVTAQKIQGWKSVKPESVTTKNYVFWKNVATGEEKFFEAISNHQGNSVETLKLLGTGNFRSKPRINK